MQEYSVALCTYNGAKYIGEQLNSIIQQTVKPAQIVISDDGSKDNTLIIAENILSNSGLDYLIVHNTVKHGVTSNFQNAFSYCTSPIIFCSDQDDVWMKHKAERMLLEYEKHPEAMLVFSDGELVDEHLNLLGCNVWKSVGITYKRIKEGDWFHYLIKNCLITGAAMSFNKELLNDVNEIPVEWLHDGWLAWLAVIHNALIPCNERLFYYRQHGNNEVGMRPLNDFWGRIKGWIKNFDDVQNTRRIRHNRYKSLYDICKEKFNTMQHKEVNECIEFWDEMISSESMNRYDAFKIYSCNFIRGNYSKFYTGFLGYVRDVLMIFDAKYFKP